MPNATPSCAWGLNEKGEVVATSGTGSNNVTGYLSQDAVPLDDQGRFPIAGLGPLITTWANRPTSPVIGQRLILTDYRNNLCVWNGSLWIPMGVWAQSNAYQGATGDVAEHTFATVVIPGGLLGPNSAFKVTTHWSTAGVGGSRTVRMRFNGLSTALSNALNTTTLYAGFAQTVRNNNSLTTQKMPPYISDNVTSSLGIATTNINTANDVVVTLSGQCTVSTDTVALEAYTLEILS